jgi:hypothetical protein
LALFVLIGSPVSSLFGEARMATVTTTAPPRTVPAPAPAVPLPAAPATAKPKAPEKGLGTDWAAMVFWTLCFAIMALIHLGDLVASLFR